MDTLRVSTRSQPRAVAGALAAMIRDNKIAHVEAVGAGAVNQAVKAIAIARGFAAQSGQDFVAAPSFSSVAIDGQDVTCIHFTVELR